MTFDFEAMIMPDHPAMLEAVNAMRRFYEAQQAGLPAPQVERLRQCAVRQFQAINDYQLAILGRQPLVRH